MRGRIPDSFIDELLARVDIVDVIERRVPLKKAGREWTACCPFHNERSPSFYVSPAKQFFHCFGCGAHGSALKFLMDYERLEFPDAVEELAQSVGLTVPREGGNERAPREDKTDLYALLDAAARWYENELPKNAEAQAYCRKRGLDEDTIKRFRIGWAPAGFDGVIKALGSNDRRMQLLNEAGMVASNERGHRYDRFRERVMFPILDRRGRVIAFGGRVLSSDQGPKYLNSPETPLFHKGRELFAMWQVKQANPSLARIVVVEGYMDVIAMHQAGLPIAVATLGTATTPEHTEVLFRAAPDVVFCFDGDRAGRAAAWKALEAALPRIRDGRQAYFLFLPDGEDPDTLIRKEGKDGFEKRLKAATPLSEYFFNELAHDVDTASLDGRARLAERARPLDCQAAGWRLPRPDGPGAGKAHRGTRRAGGGSCRPTLGAASHRGATLARAQCHRAVAGAAWYSRPGGTPLRLPAPGKAGGRTAGRIDRPGTFAPRHQPGHAGRALCRAS